MPGFKHLAAEERYQISAFRKAGWTDSCIAAELGVHKSTICREVARNSGLRGYRPKQAHAKALERKAMAGRPCRFDADDMALVEALLREDHSPEQVAGRLEMEGALSISHETVYKHVYKDKAAGGTLHTHLRCQKKRRKRYGSGKTRRGVIAGRIGIEERPVVVDKKTRIGDWEGDTVVGCAHKGALVTLVERKSRFTLAGHVGKKTSESVGGMVVELLAPYKKEVSTITFDNGHEFAGHLNISRRLDADIYFARPHSPWERGLNENTNGLLRQYFPKGCSLAEVDGAELHRIVSSMNHRPRKTLGYKSPYEVFFGETIRYSDSVKVAFQP